MMRKRKAVVIGCGARASDHIEAYRSIPETEVVACCAPGLERRKALAEKYGIRHYANAEEMIEKEQPDIAHIVTWPDVRLGLMRTVARLEVPLCTTEKPLACGVGDWRELGELEAASKTKFAVCHQVRWHQHLTKCREALRGGALGRVLFLDFSAGMNISGQVTHTLNYGMSLNGDSPAALVFGNAHGWDREDARHPAPLASEALITFQNGVRGLWTSGPVSPRAGAPDVFWQHVRVAAYAEKGRVNYEEFGRWEIVSGGACEGGDFGGMDEWRKNNIVSQAEFHKAMFRWLEDDSAAPGTNLRQSLHEWAVVLALYQSAIERRPVEMRSFNPPGDLGERYKREVV